MHILICINSNFKYEMRVKQYASVIARHGHKVHVAVCPVSDEWTRWVLEENFTHRIEKVLIEIWKDRKYLQKVSKRACKCADQLSDWKKYEENLVHLVENKKIVFWYYLKYKTDHELLLK